MVLDRVGLSISNFKLFKFQLIHLEKSTTEPVPYIIYLQKFKKPPGTFVSGGIVLIKSKLMVVQDNWFHLEVL